MSTDSVIILGVLIKKTTVFSFTGFFGGYFPMIHDLIKRQKMPHQQKIELDKEFFCIKAFIIPIAAFLITILAVAFEGITSWGAALYFGASFPVLVEKAIGSGDATVERLMDDQ